MNAFVNAAISIADKAIPDYISQGVKMASNPQSQKKSDQLLHELEQTLFQTTQQNLMRFPDLIQLTERAVLTFREDYFEIDYDYTDVVISKKVAYLVGYLAKIASDSAVATNSKLVALEGKRLDLVSRKAEIYTKTDGKTKEYLQCRAKTEALALKRSQLEKDRNNYLSDAAKERLRIEEIEEKRARLRKWCWVPFYGLYLYIDSETAASNLTGILQRLNIAEKAIHSLRVEESELLFQLHSLSDSEAKLDKDIFLVEQSLFSCIEDITFVSNQVIQYSELALFYGKINKQLENSDYNPSILLNTLSHVRDSLGNLFEKGAIAERCTRFIEGLTFRSNILYRGERLHKGEYLASLNRQYVAFLGEDNTLSVYNTERRIKALGLDTHRIVFRGDPPRLETGRLMLLNSGTLQGIIGGESENDVGAIAYNFPPDAVYNADKPSFFYVKDYNYSGTYMIKNINNMLLDVAWVSQAENASVITHPYNGGNNQKFIFERLPDLTYRISAVHSQKVLTVSNTNKIVQTSWKGTDYQKWIIIGDDDRVVKLINVYNEKVLDIPMNSSKSKQELWTYPDNGTNAQRFRLVRP